MLQKLNRTMTETATEILGKHRKKWITNELMDMCDLRRELKRLIVYQEVYTNKYIKQ